MLQVLEITDRVVVCVNLMDEAKRKGLEVDTRSLARDLGVPAVPTSARTGEGLRDLLAAVADVIEGRVQTAPHHVRGQGAGAEQIAPVERAVEELVPRIEQLAPGLPNARWIAMRLLDGDQRVRQALLNGELARLADRQREAVPSFSRKMALEGAQ